MKTEPCFNQINVCSSIWCNISNFLLFDFFSVECTTSSQGIAYYDDSVFRLRELVELVIDSNTEAKTLKINPCTLSFT